MKDITHAPPVSEQLLEYLEERFPDSLPDMDEGHSVYVRRVGEQRVIRHLRRMHEHQYQEGSVLQQP